MRRVPTGRNPHLHAGSAYAKGQEVIRHTYWTTKDLKASLRAGLVAFWQAYGYDEPNDTNKDALHLAVALIDYYTEWPPATDHITPALINDKPCGEFSFAIPLDGKNGTPNIRHPETGEPILYAGKLDDLVYFVGQLFAYDDKTSTQLGPKWPLQWRLRSQFTGYVWALRLHGIPVNGVIVRGAGILSGQIKWAEAIAYRPQWMIDEWLVDTEETIKRMILDWQSAKWPKNWDSACDSYGGCPYMSLCENPNPLRYINDGFVARTWSPIEEENQ